MQNNNCDGGKCRDATGQVRRLPTGGDSAAILCLDCFCQEINYRIDRNRDLEESCKYPLPKWSECEIYLDATAPRELRGHSFKLYQCSQCSALRMIQTNHFGQCYSWGTVNVCPVCPPYKRPTTWNCLETVPAGVAVPEDWKPTRIVIMAGSRRKARQ